MRKNSLQSLFFAGVLVGFIATNALAKELTIAGSSTVYPFTSFVAEEYASIKKSKTPIVESLGTRDTIEELVLSKVSQNFKEYGAQQGKYKSIRQDNAYIPSGENDNLIVSKLTADKQAFGLFGYGFLASNKDKINAANIDRVVASEQTIAANDYKLARSLFIYLNAKNPQTLDFATLYLSDDLASSGGELEKIGLVPLSSKDLKAMQAHIKKANRLNSTLVKAGKVF